MPNYEAVYKGQEADLKAEKDKYVVTEQYSGKKVPDFRVDAIRVEGGMVQLTKGPGFILNNVKCAIEKQVKRQSKPGFYPEILVCQPE